jgi:hypothetical protein
VDGFGGLEVGSGGGPVVLEGDGSGAESEDDIRSRMGAGLGACGGAGVIDGPA